MSIVDDTWTDPSSTGYDWSQGLNIPNDLYPRAGVSPWAQPYAQSALGGFFGGWAPATQVAGSAPAGTSGPSYALDQSIMNLGNAPQTIEQQRQAMMDQYWQTVPRQVNDLLYSKLNDLGSRGVISGTPMQNAIQSIGNTIAEGGQKTSSEASLWANQAIMDNLKNMVEARANQTSLLSSLLGQSQESTNAWTPVGDLLKLFGTVG